MLTSEKTDRLFNALQVGMAVADAYIYAGFTADDIVDAEHNDSIQQQIAKQNREFEYLLLNRMKEISQKQAKVGKESATTWLLEKLYPRYSGKPQTEIGEVHLHFDDTDPIKLDNVEVHNSTSEQVEFDGSQELLNGLD